MVSYKEILTKIRALEDIKKMQHEKPDPLSASLQELKESLKGISDKDKEDLGKELSLDPKEVEAFINNL